MNFLIGEARPLIWMGTMLYGVAFCIAGITLFQRKRYFRAVLFTLILGGWIFQTLGLSVRGYTVQACPLGNPFEILQFIIWTSVGLYVLVFPFYRINLLGFFITTFATLLGLLSLSIPGWDTAYSRGIFGGNPWVELHAALAISSYGVFGLLALISLMYLIQQYGLKSKQSSNFFRYLPSIRELDQVGLWLLSVGITILTVSILVGSIYWVPNLDNISRLKLISTMILWLAYLASLLLRVRGRLVSRNFAWCCMLLFGFALLSLWPVDTSRNSKPESLTTLPLTEETDPS